MDDILIATPDDVIAHRKIVNKVLERLKSLDLYLKPAKCEFEVRRIEFLGVILEDRYRHDGSSQSGGSRGAT